MKDHLSPSERAAWLAAFTDYQPITVEWLEAEAITLVDTAEGIAMDQALAIGLRLLRQAGVAS